MNDSKTTSSVLAIEMRDVAAGSLRDPDTILIEEVNWSVGAGDFWVIGGLQGAGKSDFLMMAGGLVPPASGTYRLLGNEMPIFEDADLAERLRLGLVFDGGQLFNNLTVLENIALPLRYHRNLSNAQASSEVQRMLEWTELVPLADSTPGAIGRPWQKRAGLARALMLKPEVLLLDNPLAGLDLRHAAWWFNFLEQLSVGNEFTGGKKMTLVATTDDLRSWKDRARQFAILKNKKLFVLGGWEQLEAASGELREELLATEPRSV